VTIIKLHCFWFRVGRYFVRRERERGKKKSEREREAKA